MNLRLQLMALSLALTGGSSTWLAPSTFGQEPPPAYPPNIRVEVTPPPNGLYLYTSGDSYYWDHPGFQAPAGIKVNAIEHFDHTYFPAIASYSMGATNFPWNWLTPPAPYAQYYRFDHHFLQYCQPGRNYLSYSVDRFNVTGRQLWEQYEPPAESIPIKVPVYRMIETPKWMEDFFTGNNGNKLTFSPYFPTGDTYASLNVPFLRRFGVDLSINGNFEYDSQSAEWELKAGFGAEKKYGRAGRRPKIPFYNKSGGRLYVGNKYISATASGVASGTATPESGIVVDEFGAELEFAGRFEGARYGLFNLFPPLVPIVAAIPYVDRSDLEPLAISLFLEPSIAGSVMFEIGPEEIFASPGGKVTGSLGLQAELTFNVFVAQATLFAGGSVETEMEFGTDDIFDEITIAIFAGFEVSRGSFTFGRKWKQEWDLNSSNSLLALGEPDLLGESSLPTLQPRLISRVAGGSDAENFVGMVARSAEAPTASSISTASAAEPPLLSNILPTSSLAAAEHQGTRMLLYTRDNGTTGGVQFTDIGFLYYDGTQWSAPAAIDTDPRAEFEPQVAFDQAGNAIAVWERFRDSSFSSMEWHLVAPQYEIVWARWDRTTGQWSTPQPLTDNASMDHSPLISRVMADGQLVVTWITNSGHSLTGTSTHPNTIHSRTFAPGTATWSSPQIVATNVRRQSSQSLTSRGAQVLYTWTQDLDGDGETPDDMEVFCAQPEAGGWTTLQLTDDEVQDVTVRTLIDADGQPLFFTNGPEGMRLIKGLNGSADPVDPLGEDEWISEDEKRISEAPPKNQFWAIMSPSEQPVLVWTESGRTTANALAYVTMTPGQDGEEEEEEDTWSEVKLIPQEGHLPKNISLCWPSASPLQVYMTRAQTSTAPRQILLDSGESVLVPNMPAELQTDLVQLTLTHGPDLALGEYLVTSPPDLSVTFPPGGQGGYLSGEVVNQGDTHSPPCTVKIYAENSTAGQTLLESVSIPSLAPGDSQWLSSYWPADSGRTNDTLKVVIDELNEVAESNEGNNTVSIDYSGSDLCLEEDYSYQRAEDGSLAIKIQMRNYGTAASGTTELKLFMGPASVPLWSSQLPAFAAGESRTLEINLPPGTHPDTIYSLKFHLTLTGGETENPEFTDNNELTIGTVADNDVDDDGIINSLERELNLNPIDGTDGAKDRDNDGATNLNEAVAGTNLDDPTSRFTISQTTMATSSSPGMRDLQIQWTSVAGKSYQIERSTDLKTWTRAIDAIAATPPLNSTTVSVADTEPRCFFRVVVR